MKESNFISVVIHYQDISKEKSELLFEKLEHSLLKNFKNYEIIIVNNGGNQENLRDFAERLGKHVIHNTITVINFSHSTGKEAAMIAGDDLAVGDYILELDTINLDFSDSILMDAYQILMKGYDIVEIGAPKIEKAVIPKIFYWLYNKGVDSEQQIQPEAFRIVSRRAFNRAKAMAKSLSFRKGVYAEGGLKRYYLEDPTLKIYGKKDNKSVDDNIQLGIRALMIFTNIMQKISTLVCGAFLIATLVISGYIVYIFLMQKPVEGWTPIMMYLSIGFLGIFVILALILKFLSVVLDIVYKNETHNIESIWKV